MMTNEMKESLWGQFGASIDMLINVISNCPDDYYKTNKRFYYLAYHSVVLLDYYLTMSPDDFLPELSFTIIKEADKRPEGSVGDMIPDSIYSKQELIDYLQASRSKGKKLVESLDNRENTNIRFTEGNQEGDMNYSIFEILLYNMRHTQHHTGQLHLMIRQDLNKHMDWAFRADDLK